MAVKIIIKRSAPGEKMEELIQLLKQLRALALKQNDYISGETLKRIDKPGQNLVISTWDSIDAWNAWLDLEERKIIQDKIDSLLGEKTSYEVYQYG